MLTPIEFDERKLKNINYELEFIAKSKGFATVDELNDFVKMVRMKFNVAQELTRRIEEERERENNFYASDYEEDFPF